MSYTHGVVVIRFQGVVTYISRVEAFATGIKIESSDQALWGTDQGIKHNKHIPKHDQGDLRIAGRAAAI